ncbi:hypothetical protein Godav_015683, partial [Gossypium davidsonii]|nr:hypothetical protein [Gossypium davidsonii]
VIFLRRLFEETQLEEAISTSVDRGCLRCGARDEMTIHALKDCLKVRAILSLGGIDGRLLDFDYERCIDWMEAAMGFVDRKAFEDFVTTFWNIWNSRNNALFWGKDEDAIVIWDQAKTLTSDFRIHNLTHEPMIPKTHCTQNWEKPPNGFTKVNIVAIVVDNMVVFGVIMRDCDDFVLGGITV